MTIEESADLFEHKLEELQEFINSQFEDFDNNMLDFDLCGSECNEG